jgi:hypothetical protein
LQEKILNLRVPNNFSILERVVNIGFENTISIGFLDVTQIIYSQHFNERDS